MQDVLIRGLSALALAGAAAFHPARAADPQPLADWTFSEAAGRSLNQTANTGAGVNGPGSTWDVAVSGVATDGSGLLNVRNTGGGGSGTRTAYADLGPYAGTGGTGAVGSVGSGIVTLYTRFAGWNLSAAGGAQFTLAFVEGNDFTTASYTLAAAAGGLRLTGGVDASGNGAALTAVGSFASAATQPLTVRLSVDLDARAYSLAWDAGNGYASLGTAAIDSFTRGVNSLRLSLAGDFAAGGAAGSGLAVDRLWVVQGPVASVPEPGPAALWCAGLVMLLAMRSVRSVRRR